MADASLSEEEINGLLEGLPGWTFAGNQLHRSFRFKDFSAAMGFMMRAAFVCEQLNHHPNWYNVYGKVDVQLWTHTARGVTALDIRLAKAMSELAEQTPGET